MTCCIARVLGGLTITSILGAGCATAEGLTPPTYSAKEIRAAVVDEETGQPLEGVVVVARWVLRRMGGDGPSLHVAETVTDAQGRFAIPAWSPKPRPPLMELREKSPELILFKHGYEPIELINQSKQKFAAVFPTYREMPTRAIMRNMIYGGMPDQPVQEAFWNDLTIQLAPFRGTPERWLFLLGGTLPWTIDNDAPHIRRLLMALKAERQHLDKKSLDQTLWASFETFFGRLDRLLK